MTDERLEELLTAFGNLSYNLGEIILNSGNLERCKAIAEENRDAKQSILNHIKENYRRNDE